MKIGILWDLDGTLLDTLDDLTSALNAVLEQSGYLPRTREEVRAFVGNGPYWLIRRALPESVDDEERYRVLAAFREYYKTHVVEHTRPFAGIPEVLQKLGQQYPMAVVSNKQDEAVKALCAHFFPGIYALGETEICPRKPAPDMIQKAMADLGVETCIYIGDSEVDVQTAKNAQVPCLSVVWGFRDENELAEAGAKYLCREPGQLAACIEEIIKEQF